MSATGKTDVQSRPEGERERSTLRLGKETLSDLTLPDDAVDAIRGGVGCCPGSQSEPSVRER